jgi:hypothetical protein
VRVNPAPILSIRGEQSRDRTLPLATAIFAVTDNDPAHRVVSLQINLPPGILLILSVTRLPATFDAIHAVGGFIAAVIGTTLLRRFVQSKIGLRMRTHHAKPTERRYQ